MNHRPSISIKGVEIPESDNSSKDWRFGIPNLINDSLLPSGVIEKKRKSEQHQNHSGSREFCYSRRLLPPAQPLDSSCSSRPPQKSSPSRCRLELRSLDRSDRYSTGFGHQNPKRKILELVFPNCNQIEGWSDALSGPYEKDTTNHHYSEFLELGNGEDAIQRLSSLQMDRKGIFGEARTRAPSIQHLPNRIAEEEKIDGEEEKASALKNHSP